MGQGYSWHCCWGFVDHWLDVISQNGQKGRKGSGLSNTPAEASTALGCWNRACAWHQMTSSDKSPHTCFISQSITDDLNLPAICGARRSRLFPAPTWGQDWPESADSMPTYDLHSRLLRIFDLQGEGAALAPVFPWGGEALGLLNHLSAASVDLDAGQRRDHKPIKMAELTSGLNVPWISIA